MYGQHLNSKDPAVKYHLVNRDITNIFVTPVVSLRLNSKFHIGFGLSYVYTKADIAVIRDLFLRDAQPSAGAEVYEAGGINDEQVTIQTTDNNIGFNVGFLWKIKKWLYFGGAYRSQIRSVDDTSIRASGSGSLTRYYDDSGYVTKTGNAKYIMQFPDSVSFGLKLRLSRSWWGDFTLNYTRWSVLKNMKIVLSGGDFLGSELTNRDLNITEYYGMKDTYSPQFTFFFTPYKGFSMILSARYSPPSTDSKWVRASNPDNHAFDFLFSTDFNIIDNLKFKIAYGFGLMLPNDVKNSGYNPSLARDCLDSHVDIVWGEGCQADDASRTYQPDPQVRLDNSTAERFTIIDVFAIDRTGLLYAISRQLFELGLSVHKAKIGTHLDQVVDVFYVTDAEGNKILAPSRVKQIRQTLLARIEQ